MKRVVMSLVVVLAVASSIAFVINKNRAPVDETLSSQETMSSQKTIESLEIEQPEDGRSASLGVLSRGNDDEDELPYEGMIAGTVRARDIAKFHGTLTIEVVWDNMPKDPIGASQGLNVSVARDGTFEAQRVPMDRPLRVQVDPAFRRDHGLVASKKLKGVQAGDVGLEFRLSVGKPISGRVHSSDRTIFNTCNIGVSPLDKEIERVFTDIGEDGTFKAFGLTGICTVYLYPSTSWAPPIMAAENVHAGTTVDLIVPPLAPLTLDCQSTKTVEAGAYVAGTLERGAYRLFERGGVVRLERLHRDKRYDVLATREGEMAMCLDVATGGSIQLEFKSTIETEGVLSPVSNAGSLCFTRQSGGPPIWAELFPDGTFATDLPEGTYNAIFCPGDGTEEVVGRGIHAGQQGIKLKRNSAVPSRTSRSKPK